MDQIHKRPMPPRGGDEEGGPAPSAPTTQVSSTAVDSLLDEIDSVLEVNAESFVRGFVQKGGE